jgi:K+-transporting ATPase ATPase C chain
VCFLTFIKRIFFIFKGYHTISPGVAFREYLEAGNGTLKGTAIKVLRHTQQPPKRYLLNGGVNMNLFKHIYPAVALTIVLTVLLGVIYPFVMSGLSDLLFKEKARGSLIEREGKVIGSRLIGQPFKGPRYFHSRPSAAGSGYDATASGGTNLGPTSKQLFEEQVRGRARELRAENPDAEIPIDLITSSASGLDPHISPAAAEFQIPRVAAERRMSQDEVRRLIGKHTKGRQFGVLGEPRVNVLELNLALDEVSKKGK